MAPQPKRKHSSKRGRVRGMARKLTMVSHTLCPSCRKPRLPHRVCPFCGYYNTRQIFVQREKKSEETTAAKVQA